MKIYESTFETLAVLKSKDRWYSAKDTNQGVCFHASVPTGHIPAMQVDMDSEAYTALSSTATFSAKLYDAEDNLVSAYAPTVSIAVTSKGCSAMISAFDSQSISNGMYYLKFSLVYGTTQIDAYSDLFVMQDASKMMHVKYKGQSVETAKSVIAFRHGSSYYTRELWLDCEFLMPPFNFEEDVTNRDGFDFVEKKVSWKNHKCWVMCSEYFADALRLMWHCDNVEIEYRGEEYDVDQVTLSVEWNESNYLCRADMEFRTDTIIQTNGVSVS